MTNEELKQEVEKLQKQISKLSLKIYGIEVEKKPYEVEVQGYIGNYYYVSELGGIDLVEDAFNDFDYKGVYQRGLAFKTREEAEQFDKERELLFKLHKWAEEHNEGWIPNWNDLDEEKCTVRYDNADEKLDIYETYFYRDFTKLPVFKSEEIAEKFIEEFGEEIKEVLC